MCSHAGHSNNKQPTARLRIDHRDFDESEWQAVMLKGQQLAWQRQQQEEALDIQKEVSFKQLIYPQSLIQLKHDIMALKYQQTLKIETATALIKSDLAAAARLLQCKIEDIVADRYLYLTRV